MDKPAKILVVQPSWVGDAVMASPALRALRGLYPDAHISYLLRRYVKPVYNGMPWSDRLLTYRTEKGKGKTGRGVIDLAARLRAGKFDTAILLSNSFKTALLCRAARIPRIIGYDRDGRGFLITDKLLPARENGRYIPTPAVRYYMGLVKYLGSTERDTRLQLFFTDQERSAAEAVLGQCGVDASIERPGGNGGKPLIMLNPGAQYGDAKCWRPEHFAEVGDRFAEEMGATVLINGAPRERKILDAVLGAMRHPAIDLSRGQMTLGALKEIVRRCDLMVTNDTGPRHIAAAFGVPVVTIFGPTDPRWTEIDFPLERQVAVQVFCGPCQKKRCPLDHRCMTRVSPAMVLERSAELLGRLQTA